MMRLGYALLCSLALSSVSAFTAVSRPASVVQTPIVRTTTTVRAPFPLGMAKSNEEMTLEEEIEMLVQEEKAKSSKMSRMRDAKGIEYAPWMKISPEDEAKIRAIMREKAEARRKRQLQEQNVQGSLLKDSTNQELSGTGLRSKIVDGNSVELTWATGREKNTKGFLVKRRPAKTDDFVTIASYESYGPLASKGIEGGLYRYLDDGVGVGNWVYRVTECESNGNENDLSQCLVEIQTAEEQQQQTIALAGLGIIAAAVVAAGFLLDPSQ